MTQIKYLFAPLCAGALFTLAACATPGQTKPEAVAPVVAADATVPTEPSSEKVAISESGEEDMICKRQAVVGSNFKRKVCGTKEQWEQANEVGRNFAGTNQRTSPTGTGN